MRLAREMRPDLIFMDIVMPRREWLPGHAHARRTTRKPASIPIIMVTSKDQETDRIWGMRQGAVDYMVKPVSEDLLVAKAQEVLERNEGQRA